MRPASSAFVTDTATNSITSASGTSPRQSRHIARGPTVINAIVSTAIGNMMFNQLEDFVQLDKAP